MPRTSALASVLDIDTLGVFLVFPSFYFLSFTPACIVGAVGLAVGGSDTCLQNVSLAAVARATSRSIANIV